MTAVALHHVVLWPSDIRGAGTDADISVILTGDKGSSKELRLESSANNFERGKVSCIAPLLGGSMRTVS